MAEFEDKLNAILNDPQAMGQILSAAKALSGQQEEPESGHAEADTSDGEAPDPLAALGQLDPKLVQLGLRLFSEYTGNDDKKTALLEALKPFLRPERQAKVEQAVKIAKLTKVIRTAFQLFQDRREEADDV
ncbi:hypothetical protein [Intestinimonas massiliensis (ex Afouda et al. 2020)]|uniref:hypothetical protein n=1 Tax=Intestinimonas massiliensis (ex Afouda et al. 2020) TaxID=1673721 RepID=UPI00102FB540|nr:hypothetical protein [Intestinimonas massiliensis (ex Afouda et al. 2020)]